MADMKERTKDLVSKAPRVAKAVAEQVPKVAKRVAQQGPTVARRIAEGGPKVARSVVRETPKLVKRAPALAVAVGGAAVAAGGRAISRRLGGAAAGDTAASPRLDLVRIEVDDEKPARKGSTKRSPTTRKPKTPRARPQTVVAEKRATGTKSRSRRTSNS